MAKQSPLRPHRTEVLAQIRADHQRKELRARRLWIVGGIVLTVMVAGSIAYALVSTRASSRAPAITGVHTYKGLSQSHVTTPVQYPQTPPVGGQHNPTPLTCGIYTSPVPNENAVHAMEHGAVWIVYRPGLPANDVTSLQDTARGQSYVILSPYPGLKTAVVASAWGTQLSLTRVTDPRLSQFISAYASGPQTPEPGAPCQGTGTPAG